MMLFHVTLTLLGAMGRLYSIIVAFPRHSHSYMSYMNVDLQFLWCKIRASSYSSVRRA